MRLLFLIALPGLNICGQDKTVAGHGAAEVSAGTLILGKAAGREMVFRADA